MERTTDLSSLEIEINVELLEELSDWVGVLVLLRLDHTNDLFDRVPDSARHGLSRG